LLIAGARQENITGKASEICSGNVLVIDDSVYSGTSIKEAKEKIRRRVPQYFSKITWTAVYVTPAGCDHVDIYFEEIKGHRIFEWNIMHSKIIQESCVDIDGVLCRDPTDEENDDGEKYKKFLSSVKPLRTSSVKIKYLVTSRLEKYRALTENWLKKHNIHHEKLYMMDVATMEERRARGNHAQYKAEIFASTGSPLFIESASVQAERIACFSNKPVLCIENQKMYYPSIKKYAAQKMRYLPAKVLQVIKKQFLRKFLSIDPPR
jgi:uncharacterized HAD superfamily protein